MTPDNPDRDALFKKLGLVRGSDITPDAPRKPEPAAAEPHADSLERDSARRLREHLGLLSGGEWRQRRERELMEREQGAFEVDRVLGGEIVTTEDGGFFLLRSEYPLEHVHGALPLETALRGNMAHLAFTAMDNTLAGFDLRRTFFMDTETTGLAGGAGTVAFLVGIGRFTEDSFRLDQCFMRDFDDEEPMLAWLAEQFKECGTVASFNGKSFDLPLLRTRFIQNRIPFRLDGAGHLDLVHTARRVWKRRINDCSLGNVEREVLGVRRHGDVPGHLIPQMWLDYLHTRDARPLQGVFYHHRMDILSLVSLVGVLSQSLDRPDGGQFEHAEDQLSLVRLHFRQKQYERVIELGSTYLEQDDRSPLRRECLEMLALAFKRRDRWVELGEHLELWHREFPSDPMAASELAKHLEHRARNLVRAGEVCRETLDRMMRGRAIFGGGTEQPGRASIEDRLARIEKKLRRGGVFPEDDGAD